MRIILVTSSATYLKDNYLHLLNELISGKALPPSCRIVALFLLKTHNFSLILKALGLMMMKVTGIGSQLLLNSFRAMFYDERTAICKKNQIPFYRFDSINSRSAVEAAISLKPHIIINLRTREIYKKQILSIPELGCINVHHGLLPGQRGVFCDLWSWVNGETAGFTVHKMNRKIDDGPILEKKEIDVSDVKNYLEIPQRFAFAETGIIRTVLEKIISTGEITGIPNSDENARFYKNPTASEIEQIMKRGFRL